MIRAFNGCAVENAVDSVKAAAECTVPDVAGSSNILKNHALSERRRSRFGGKSYGI